MRDLYKRNSNQSFNNLENQSYLVGLFYVNPVA